MLPCISSLLFALHPMAVAQTQMRMAPCRLVHQLHHAVFQGMDGQALLQLPMFEQKYIKKFAHFHSICSFADIINVQNETTCAFIQIQNYKIKNDSNGKGTCNSFGGINCQHFINKINGCGMNMGEDLS